MGEAYLTFVGSNPKLNKIIKSNVSYVSKWGEDESEYVEDVYVDVEGPTGKVVDLLVEKADLKDNTQKAKLAAALAMCVNINDDCYVDDGSMREDRKKLENQLRAQSVSKIWMQKVIPPLP